jgi:hypothetical protein
LDRHNPFTERRALRQITMADADRLAVFHADARVMNLLQHGVLTRAEGGAVVPSQRALAKFVADNGRTLLLYAMHNPGIQKR